LITRYASEEREEDTRTDPREKDRDSAGKLNFALAIIPVWDVKK